MMSRKSTLTYCLLITLGSCASTTRRDKETPKQIEPDGPSASSLLSKVPDRNDQKMSQIFLTTTKNGKKTTTTWCEGISHDNEPVVKRELTKTGLCFRKICEEQKCEEIGNPQIPRKTSSQTQTKTARSI